MLCGDDAAAVRRAALALALGAAVSLGLARFAYALLLPPMRLDLQWSYFTSGAMNTVNAAGYLVGALMAPRWLVRHDARRVFLVGMVAAALLLALHAAAAGDVALYALRGATGVASAATFISGGLLAARLGTQVVPGHGAMSSSLVLGLYYGGTGAGIVASALLVPAAAQLSGSELGWRWAWALLGGAALAAAWLARRGTRALAGAPNPSGARARFAWASLRWGLLSYLMFGLGYIAYMTFVITLLREQGAGPGTVTLFYVLLGLGVMVSPWLWARLLQRHRGGVPIAVLNGLLAVATALPVLGGGATAAHLVSGSLFGAVFLSLVASTTAMVKHNVDPAAWSQGIAAFTIVFALGQIVGPSLAGLIADGAGGLARGFVVSAVMLALGSVFGLMQRPVVR